jgi:hypothetical protein
MQLSRPLRSTAFLGGLTALLLMAGCGGGGGTPNPNVPTPGSSTNGSLNLTVTDAPSDSWQQVSVVLKSASLRTQGTDTWTQVWTADPTNPTSGLVNLVDLNSVADLLGKASVPAGTYDRLQLTIDPTPASMTLVDDNGTTIPTADISVVDPSGKGQINVVIDPTLTITSGATASLQADFDLAHPLSIVQETIGGVTKVVLNLQVRHKALPTRIQDLQFARKIGLVGTSTPTALTITDSRNATFTYIMDAGTIFFDADAKTAGTQAGLTAGKYAMVASNLNADGTLYARRVWYAAAAATLPARTPEGLVRRVNVNGNSFTVFNKTVTADAKHEHWGGQTIKVDAATVWTFHTTVPMGTGTAPLQNIWRGCRVDVQLDSAGTTATAVNVNNAHDEGFISSASATGLTFGLPGMARLPMSGGILFGMDDPGSRTWNYYQNAADTANSFSWWYFGLPSAASTVIQDLRDTVTTAQTASLPVTGSTSLYWDTVSSSWQASKLVLDPEMLRAATITTAYADAATAGTGTLGIKYLAPNATTLMSPMNVILDYTGDLQTVVESVTWDSSTRLMTLTVPVDHAQWAALLTPPTAGGYSAARIWVRPVKNGSAFEWHAYTVEVFTAK